MTRILQTDLARDALYTKVNQIADEKVGLTGDETIAGVKTFSVSPNVPTPSMSSNTTVPVTSQYINLKFQVLNSAPANRDPDTFYFIKE